MWNACKTSCPKNSDNSKEHLYSKVFFAENTDWPTFKSELQRRCFQEITEFVLFVSVIFRYT